MYMVYLYDLDGNILKEYGPMAKAAAWETAEMLGNIENNVEVIPAS